MTNLTVIRGNIFTSHCQTLVNTINCDGVMGAGIALEFKFRHPVMFLQYAEHCMQGRIDIGKLWIYKPPPESRDERWVLNFPTKRRWKNPSRIEYLEQGLSKFVDTHRDRGIESIAFPILGSSNGGLDERVSLSLMTKYLERCHIPVEIYEYDASATDDLYEEFRAAVLASADDSALAKTTGLQVSRIRVIRAVLEQQSEINSLSRLATVKGIGAKTLERCFRFVMAENEGAEVLPPRQATLSGV